MPDRPAADRTANLLLWFRQEPLRYRSEVRRRDQPAFDSEVVLKLALGRRVEFADPALSSVSAAAWREAAATYVRQVFFRPHATPYQTLGLAPGASAQAIKENFRLLMQLVHPDRQGARPLWPESYAARANRAYGILRHDESRAALDREEAERAERAHATQQKATAAAMAPTPRWPLAGLARRRAPPPVVAPEWLTAGVGGFMRRHPAGVAFAVLLCGAALVISAMMWDGEAGSLTRVARAPSLPTQAPARIATEPVMMAVEPEVAREAQSLSVPAPAAAPIAAEAVTTAPEAGRKPVPRLPAVPSPARTAAEPVKVAAEPEPKPAARAPSPPAPARSAAEPVKTAVDPGASLVSRQGDGGTKMPPATALPAAASGTVPTVRSTVGPRPDAAHAAPSVAAGAAAVPRASTTLAAANPRAPVAALQPLTTAEIDALSAAFVDAYDRGRLDTFAALFDDNAETNLYRGRAAIRNEYGELFRLSEWRQMQLKQIHWRRVGERAYAQGEIAVRIGWRDGRQVEQRVAIDMEVARRDGRVVITRLAHKPSPP